MLRVIGLLMFIYLATNIVCVGVSGSPYVSEMKRRVV